LILASTDAVYSDLIKKHVERENCKPSSIYGYNKLKSEKYMRKNLSKYIILRFATVYDKKINQDQNFINTSLNKIKNKNKVVAASNIYRNFISIQSLTKIIDKLIHLKINGTFNVGEKKSNYYNKIKSLCIKQKVNYKKYLIKGSLDIIPKQRELDLTKIKSLMINYQSKNKANVKNKI
jgi:dTDP-4-dehydrorhamnose reductase